MLRALWPHQHEILVALRGPTARICTKLSYTTPCGSVIVVESLIVFDSIVPGGSCHKARDQAKLWMTYISPVSGGWITVDVCPFDVAPGELLIGMQTASS